MFGHDIFHMGVCAGWRQPGRPGQPRLTDDGQGPIRFATFLSQLMQFAFIAPG